MCSVGYTSTHNFTCNFEGFEFPKIFPQTLSVPWNRSTVFQGCPPRGSSFAPGYTLGFLGSRAQETNHLLQLSIINPAWKRQRDFSSSPTPICTERIQTEKICNLIPKHQQMKNRNPRLFHVPCLPHTHRRTTRNLRSVGKYQVKTS